MSDSDIVSSIKPLIEIFIKLKIPYYIGGSVASSAFGKARSTLDVDVVAPISLLIVKQLAEDLKGTYYVSENDIRDAVTHNASFNIIHLQTMIKVDVFILKNREYDHQAFERKQENYLDDENQEKIFYLAAPEDVVIYKLEWFKAGDELSERQWNDVIGVLKVQAERLNMPYLLDWAKKLGLHALLEKALKESRL
jgi:hypothetical protein